MVPCELYVPFRVVLRVIESANKSFDILMNRFKVFINFHIRSDDLAQLNFVSSKSFLITILRAMVGAEIYVVSK